ncbi:MAG: 4-hydroxyphenylpyruvate dioxygenase [Planctomycetes bacterium]|nr:4-hydroxyphenylpyruvate dioxygenase [Planctomycetota bacterium]
MSSEYVKTDGLAFVEFSGNNPQLLAAIFDSLGFAKTGQHADRPIELYSQGSIRFISNPSAGGNAEQFRSVHCRGACALGFRVDNAREAQTQAIALGAIEAECRDYDIPAIRGVGESLIYLVDDGCQEALWDVLNVKETPNPSAGLLTVDHLTHNLERGNLARWRDFYETVFGFRKLRSFRIEGKKTGLYSEALASPGGKIMIPLNESLDEQSQIQEFIDKYHGEGIQHIALSSSDLYATIRTLRNNGIPFQETPDAYFDLVDDRVPGHGEDVDALRDLNILIDGGEAQGGGLLLQIFTKESIGPIFFEFIQRKGNEGFGEGNFQALFESIELDQIRRGVVEV